MVTTRLATIADLEALSSAGVRYELVRGEIRTMAPASPPHGYLAARAAMPFFMMIASDPSIGEGFIADAGFVLEVDPDTVLAPDFTFVRAADLSTMKESGFSEIALTAVIEVVTPSESKRDVEEKIEIYRRFGVPMIWTVQPTMPCVWVDGACRERVIKTEVDMLEGGDVLPELPHLSSTDIFR